MCPLARFMVAMLDIDHDKNGGIIFEYTNIWKIQML